MTRDVPLLSLAAATLALLALVAVASLPSASAVPAGVTALTSSASVFSPNGDGTLDSVTITVTATAGQRLYLNVYNSEQSLVRTALPLSETTPGTYVAVWDGRAGSNVLVTEAASPFRIKVTDGTAGKAVNEAAIATSVSADLTPPAGVSLSIDSGARFAASRDVTLSIRTSDATTTGYHMRAVEGAADAAFSGVAFEPIGSSKPFSISAGDGSKTLRLQVRDAAGNVATTATATITLDLTNPTASLSINSDASETTTSAVTLGVTASDANGVAQMRLSNDGGATFPNGWESFTSSKSWVLSPGTGTRTVLVEVRDGAGRTAKATDSITVASSAPSGQRLRIQGGATLASSASVSLSVDRPDATYTHMSFSNTGLPGSFSAAEAWPVSGNSATKAWTLANPTVEGLKTVFYRLTKDGASTDVTGQIVLDLTNPAASFSIEDSAGNPLAVTRSAWVTLRIVASDANGITGARVANTAGSLENRAFTEIPASGLRGFCLGDGSKTTEGECPAPATEGERTILLQSRDASGRVSATAQRSVIFDATAPTGLAIAAAAGAFTGEGGDRTRLVDIPLVLAASDAVSSASQLTMAFAVDDGAYSKFEPFATTKTLSIPASARTDGAHTIRLKVRDLAGNEAAPVSLAFVLDRTPPTGTLDVLVGAATNPATTTTRSVTLSFAVSDATTGGSGVTRMRVWYDSEPEPTTLTEFAGTVSATLPDADGERTLRARVLDAVGNALLLERKIVLDRAAPTGLLVSATQGFFRGTAGDLTNAITIPLALSATDAVAAKADLTMAFAVDEGAYSDFEPFTVTRDFTLPEASRSDGARAIHVKVRDPAGNEAGPATLSFRLDRTAPAGGFDLVVGETTNPARTTTRDVTLAIDASDATAGLDKLRFWFDDEAEPSTTSSYTGSIAVSLPNEDGPRVVHLRLFDAAGNDALLADRSIVLDRIAPAVSFTIPAADATGVSRTAALQIGFSEAMDRASIEAALSIDPSAGTPSFAWSEAGDRLSITFATLRAGTKYTVTVAAGGKDLAGHPLDGLAWSFRTAAPVDPGSGPVNAPPQITSFGPTGTVQNPRPQITATYADDEGINVASVALTLDGAEVALGNLATATGFRYTPPADLAPGLHTARLTLLDSGGLSASVSWTFTVAVAAPPPTEPECLPPCVSVAVQLPPNVATQIPAGHPVVSEVTILTAEGGRATGASLEVETLETRPAAVAAPPGKVFRLLDIRLRPTTAGDDLPTIERATIRFTVERSWLATNGIDPSQVLLLHWNGRAWEPLATRSVSAEGESLTYEAVTTGFSPFAIAGDDAPPTVTAIEPASGATVATLPRLRFRVADNVGIDPASVTLTLDGKTIPATAVGNDFTATPGPLADGAHTAKATGRDLVGNPAEATWTFTTDATPPTLKLTATADSVSGSWSDATSGVDAKSFRVTLDGKDVTSAATATATGFTLPVPKDLAPGKHTVEATVRDAAGNAATSKQDVEGAPAPTVPPTPTAPAPSTPAPTGPATKGGIPTWVWILLALGVLGAVVVFVVRRK